MRIFNKIKNDSGNLVLETALIIPTLLFVSYFMISATLTTQHETLMRYALDQTTKELSVLIPFIELAEQKIDEHVLGDLKDQFNHIDDRLKEAAGDLAASVYLQDYLHSTVEKWLKEGASQLRVKIPPDQRKIVINHASDHALEFTMYYHIYTPWTKTEKSVVSFLPLWTQFDGNYKGKDELADDDDDQTDSIWSEHNFVRGKYFREKYKANLPFNYPVISVYQKGKITSIRSLDLTAPSYQNELNLEKQLLYEVDQLVGFNGSTRDTGLVPNQISSSDIKSKQLILILPKNSHYSLTDSVFLGLKDYADSQGIGLNIELHGNSYRYQEKEE